MGSPALGPAGQVEARDAAARETRVGCAQPRWRRLGSLGTRGKQGPGPGWGQGRGQGRMQGLHGPSVQQGVPDRTLWAVAEAWELGPPEGRDRGDREEV